MGENTDINRSLYVLPNDTPVCLLNCEDAFKSLTAQEKKYAHYMSKASFDGALSVFLQVSPESPAICYVLYKLFKAESLSSLKGKALSVGFTEEEWTALLVYAAGFYSNSGNYKGFGDTKMVPGVETNKITALIKASSAFAGKKDIASVWATIEPVIGSLRCDQLQLGFGGEGVTCYHSDNIGKDDIHLLERFFKENSIELWNTRLFKEIRDGGNIAYHVAVACAEHRIVEKDFQGCTILIEYGDYAPIMRRVQNWLKRALDVAANENQRNMIQKYVEHFGEGHISMHKDASRYWIKDVGPTIESYIGFIENYRDPAGTRSEFEGFVAAVNKETSKKFQALVSRAEDILKRLPWGPSYEKDRFLKPDFTSLDVIAFGSSGIPAGINIPNYDDIRQDEGFKNVSLGNVISAQPKQKMNFLDQEDEELMFKYHKDSFEVQVGLHELLGHGSGKLFQRNADGSFNFDKETVKNLVNDGPVTSWYEPGETWSSKFGALASAYEECRAEAVGYVLCCDEDILEIFGYKGDEGQLVKYVNWLSEIRAGLLALEFYQPNQKKWGQAHCYARYVLTKVVLEAGQGFVEISEFTGEDGMPDLHFKMDRTKIDTVGKPAVNAFLAKLQAFKSMGDFQGGKALFESYGAIGEKELHWRDICVARRKPRRVFLQANTAEADDGVSLISYSVDFAGIVESFIERYEEAAIDDLLTCWQKDRKWFPKCFQCN